MTVPLGRLRPEVEPIRVATRKSPLALRQSELTIAALSAACPAWRFELVPMSTIGDERLQWSLPAAGGKGLFTSALEQAIAAGDADLAVHSAKDLPTSMAEGLVLAGYLPRADVRDRLVLRAGGEAPGRMGTSSPRRRAQLQGRFAGVEWVEIRGNVATRLDKVVSGEVDGTVMAVAGHDRLGIHDWPGLEFEDLAVTECVPAPGQGAIGLQCRAADRDWFQPLLCAVTARAVDCERAVLAALGGGCHSATAVHYAAGKLHFFDEGCGYRELAVDPAADIYAPEQIADWVRQLKA